MGKYSGSSDFPDLVYGTPPNPTPPPREVQEGRSFYCCSNIFKKHNKLTKSGGSESGCLFLREENLCWLRAEKRRRDSRLREARCRKDEVRLNGARLAGSPLARSWPTVVVTKLRASWKDLLTVPIH